VAQQISYRTVNGFSIFYREAGPRTAPTILSSRMFEPLLTRLKFSGRPPGDPGTVAATVTRR
jgi:hypothetical protein